MKKVNDFVLAAKMKLLSFLRDEQGDTNWISVIVLVGIAIALAVVFIAFKDAILETVNGWLPDSVQLGNDGASF